MQCNLCLNTELTKVISDDNRDYYLCNNCNLISVSQVSFISAKEEKERYLTHNNGIEFKGYVDFLNQAIEPALQFIDKNMIGLDYGCGHTPTLSILLEQNGYLCEDYDPFFVKNELNKKYDFIFSTEVFEHFFNPKKEIEKIMNLIKKDGILIVMTEKWHNLEQLNNNWHYLRDSTHMVFFHNKTFNYICKEFGLKIIYDDKSRTVILKKV
jgi:SAM-dependent methyltransferase